jgi:hypothetical protein
MHFFARPDYRSSSTPESFARLSQGIFRLASGNVLGRLEPILWLIG